MQTNNHKQIRENTALQPLTVKMADGRLRPNEIRWNHAESETLQVGKLGRGTLSSCFQATSKPFGKVKPGMVGGVSSRMPEVKFERHKVLSVRNLSKVAAFFKDRDFIGPKQPFETFVVNSTFDENRHAVKVAQVTQGIQSKLEKVFNGARVKTKRQSVLKRKESTKGEVLQLKDIPRIEGFKPRVPEFLSREPKTEIGACLERSEKVERLTYSKPSNGGRAGRVERWGE